MPAPSLALISHGTSSPEGQSVIEALAAAVAADVRARGLIDEVRLGHVDVQSPDVAEVLAGFSPDAPTILVPLLLSPGYHVHVDLAEALATAGATGESGARDIRLTPTLGPDPRLARILADRLPPLHEDDHVVLAAAGSSDARADAACLEVSRSLATELGRPVAVGFHAGAGPALSEIVEQKRALGGRVVLSSYLLAPGFFQDLAQRIVTDTGDVLTQPLLHSGAETPPMLVDIVRDRVLTSL
ncbi:sirohydrochlorin ferrochelatase [Brevibacterium sanguinis]|uniref:Sirohydrochlorin ferrochelatase n=2 Tax=Brevibacterium TaxID=1696 RepID=A0A366ICF6_9MICO|nr:MULTISPECIES: CbiX/SirB N-terminal domain-containing protein [Brevibacterium]RBP61406.1 sirohydrochlorin ferrochelatase [Brevibacterium sanguinis]RBP68489.1 sirohydrochlorin ferrochelatase [Brevibacterium celere]